MFEEVEKECKTLFADVESFFNRERDRLSLETDILEGLRVDSFRKLDETGVHKFFSKFIRAINESQIALGVIKGILSSLRTYFERYLKLLTVKNCLRVYKIGSDQRCPVPSVSIAEIERARIDKRPPKHLSSPALDPPGKAMIYGLEAVPFSCKESKRDEDVYFHMGCDLRHIDRPVRKVVSEYLGDETEIGKIKQIKAALKAEESGDGAARYFTMKLEHELFHDVAKYVRDRFDDLVDLVPISGEFSAEYEDCLQLYLRQYRTTGKGA